MKTRWVPFAYGFRPFFLLAGIYAVFAVAAWTLMHRGDISVGAGWPPQLWHAHEMVFGFVVAAIAGFMLTAVPSWTGQKGFAGPPLIALTLLWLAGRVGFVAGSALPAGLVVFAELLFLPALILTLAPALLRTTNRNTPLLLVLAALWMTDAVFLFAADRGNAAMASTALRVAIDIILVLITVIGGRITPSFTANALRRRNVDVSFRSAAWLERMVILAMLAVVVVDVVSAGRATAVPVVAAAAVLQGLRLARWHSLKTLDEPIVWILHVAYLWLPIGLALRAAFEFGGFPWASHWQHALAAGAAATMILAVMTRASLGHTGRALVAAKPVVLAYVVLLLAVLVRVFGPAMPAVPYATTILVAGALWVLAFLLYVVVYAPILLRSRIDGRPG